MASIGGLSGTTSNSLGNIRGYGGLASGLDRDSLIEGMTQGTMTKIYKQQQKKTRLLWEQSAIRNITDKMVSFSEKYLSSYSSTTNLFSDSFWGRNKISVLGANSKFVSVSGSPTTADTVSVLGVKQLAQNAQMTSGANVSDRILQTGEIDPLEVQKTGSLEGKTIEINYGDHKYTLTLPSGKDYKYGTVEEVKNSLNTAFKDYKLHDGKTLGEVLDFQTDGDKLSIKSKIGDGNILKLTGGTALSHLGFDAPDGKFTEQDITTAGITSTRNITEDDLFTKTPFIDRIAGGELTFTYNGESKVIKMPTKEELEKVKDNGPKIMETIKDTLQKQLDDAFGAGRVKVDATPVNGKYQLGFKTTLPKDGADDTTSLLSIDSGTPGLLGSNGALKTNYGESNRLNLDVKLSESGLKGAEKLTFPAKISINNVEIEVTDKDTVYTLMEKINKSDAGVEMSYQMSSDRFVFKAKANGASGKIEVGGDFEKIFGAKDQFKKTEGQDAIVRVKYAGTGEEVELNRDSNSFKIDGLTISVNGEFGYKDNNGVKEYDASTEAVTFDAKVDEDKVVEAMKKMVEEYNEIIELVNKETGTKPNRDFQPLTDAQKKDMSKEEIERWEEKAKEGLLFNDNDMKGLSNGLRFAIDPANLAAMKKLGITTSSTTSDNGKISFDENAFRSALKTDPEGVKKMFTQEQGRDANGVPTGTDGIATNMRQTFDKYVRTLGEPKGVLIERAGSIKAPASITKNHLYKEMAQVDKQIAKLQSALKMEQDRYIKQFTALESVIAQMNSQSGWLAQFGGGF